MHTTVLDVIILGAGVSGIGMACTLKRVCPQKSFVVLDRRARVGGTWDLFRYPGVRSDSDMHSYAYSFRPWASAKVLGDGAAILGYLGLTVHELGVEPHIRHGVEVESAAWCSDEQCWTVRARGADGACEVHRAKFLVFGTGYYDHRAGHTPDLPEMSRFRGLVVHPQHWPETLDVRGKRVVVVGSGATAVSLVPALAARGAQVSMLQRSPSYLLALPSVDRLAAALSRFVSEPRAFAISRAVNIAFGRVLYGASRRSPKLVRRLLLALVRRALGGEVDMRDFTPDYDPWAQRLCIVADGDLFEAVARGSARVVTDHIAGFDKDGIRLRSGRVLPADIVVTATGLQLQALGGIDLRIDGAPYDVSQRMLYRGALLEGAPNVAWVVGYVNASWTLKADLTASYVCRLLRHMDCGGFGAAVPIDSGSCRLSESILDVLASGYVRRSQRLLPRQGRIAPWRVTHDYAHDRRLLLDEPIDDGVLRFTPKLARHDTSLRTAFASNASDRAVTRRSLRVLGRSRSESTNSCAAPPTVRSA